MKKMKESKSQMLLDKAKELGIKIIDIKMKPATPKDTLEDMKGLPRIVDTQKKDA